MAVIGVDLGTTGCKSLVFDRQGAVLGEACQEYDLIQTAEGFIEQDAAVWWSMVQQTIVASVRQSGIAPDTVSALSISSQGIAVVPVDVAGQPLTNAISWLDNRADHEATQIRAAFGDQDIFQRTGKRITPGYTLPKLMWIKQHQPEIYSKTAKFLLPLDYLTFRLTGRQITDYSMASGTMAFNINTGKWDEQILSVCGIDMAKLPDTAVAGSLVGTIDAAVAAELGLDPRLQVYLGAQDQKCAALGAGIRPGIATVSLGTASAISTMHQRPVLDDERRMPCFALGDNRWVLESVIGTACVSLKWFRDTLLPDLSYADIDQLASASVPGSHGVLFYPHLEGAGSPFWQSGQRGFLYGFSLATNRGDLLRSILEGIACQIRTNINLQEQITGDRIHEIMIFGGGSRSDLWCALIAAITGKPVNQFKTAEIANLGAASLAAGGCAGDGSFDARQQIRKQYRPDPADQRVYEQLYQQYSQLECKIMT